MKRRYKPFGLILLAFGLLFLENSQAQAQTQIAIPGHNNTYTGYSRGFYFTAPIDMIITHLKAPTNASSTGLQTFEVLKYSGSTISGTPTQLGYWRGVAASDSVDTNIFIAKGSLIGIIGHRYSGSVTQTNFTAINSYTPNSTAHTTTIDGNTVSLGRFGYQDNLGRGASNGANLINATGGNLGRVLVYWQLPNQDIQPLVLESPRGDCGLGKAESIKLRIANNGINLTSGDSIRLGYKVGSGTKVNEWLVLSSAFNQGTEISYTFSKKHDFSTASVYDMELTASSIKDSTISNDTIRPKVTHSSTVSKFPYSVGWESGNDGWFSEVNRGSNQWELGTPAQTSISKAHGGKNAWVTDLDGDHKNQIDIALNSPCFDLSKVNNPSISVWLRLKTEANFDGLVLERSLNSGVTWTRVDTVKKNNFYNDTTSSLVLGAPMWSGDNGGWRLFSTIDTAAAKKSDVRYRFRFASGAAKSDEGVAVDDFTIKEAPTADLGVVGILNPSKGICGSTGQNVGIILKNYGVATQDSIPVHFSGSGNISVSNTVDTFFGSIAAGAVDTLYFRSTINTAKGGRFNMTAFTKLTADKENTNDSLFSSITLIGIPSVPTGSGGQRCNAGPVTLIASSSGAPITWYGSSSGGAPVAFGDTVSMNIHRTDTFYAEAGKTLPMPIRLSEIDLGGPDYVEVQNMSTAPFDAKGYYVVVSDNYTVINTRNATLWALDRFTAGQVKYKTDDANDNYWGSNLFFNPGNTGWAMIIDTLGKVYDYVAWGWAANDIANQSFSITFGGTANTYSPSSSWSGAGVSSCGTGGTVMRQGSKDNDDNSDWTCATGSKGSMNTGLSTFSSCASARVRIIATMLPSPTGMTVKQGVPYNALRGDGTATGPDTLCLADTLTYEITPPRGFTNSEFGTLWTIGNIVVEDTAGNKPKGLISTGASSSGNASLQLVSDSADLGRVYKVSMVATIIGSKCDTILTDYIFVSDVPSAVFTANDACLGSGVNFSNQSKSSNNGTIGYLWDFGDGSKKARNKNPSHTYLKDSQYTVTLEVRSHQGSCRTYATKTVSIYPIPVPNFSSSGACARNAVSFSDSSTINSGSIAKHEWTFGDDSTSTLANPTHTYRKPGEYKVRLTVTSNGGCSKGITIKTQIYQTPITSFVASDTCESDSFAFDNTSRYSGGGTVTYNWNFGDGNQSTDVDPKHLYATANKYDVQIVAKSSDGCADSITQSVEAYPDPAASFTFSDQCLGDTTKFTSTSTIGAGSIANYEWNLGSAIASGKDASLVFGTAGTTDVELRVISDNGCEDIVKLPVEIYALPVANFSGADVCQSDSVEFVNSSTTTSSSLSHSWDFGDGNTSTDEAPKYQYATDGKYTVLLTTTTAEGCEDVSSKDITIFGMPTVSFTADDVCVDEEFTPTNNSTANTGDLLTYGWDFGDGNTATAKTPKHAYTSAGKFTITLAATTQKKCVDQQELEIEAYALPDASFTTGNMGKGRYNFTPTDGGLSSYSWDFGDGNTSTDQTPEHKYDSKGSYNVTLTTVNANSCEKSETVALGVTTDIDGPNVKHAMQVYPNPFKNSTNIKYQLSNDAQVTLEVYDATGKRVASLVQAEQSAGEYSYSFNSQLNSGVFLVRLSVDGERQIQQIIQNN